MIRDLAITDTFTVPIEIATRKTSIVAKSDSGKSYALRRILECIVKSGFAIPGAHIDPLGVAYGVRYGPDGESAGLPVPIFGGSHGDMPITPGSGPKIARALIESRTIGILDLSALDDEEQYDFVRDFVRAAGSILSAARQPFWLGADEADLFAPESPSKAQVECQRAVRYYCRRVRNFGGGYTFATQSTSVIDKKVVGQSDLIIAMHITSPTDQKPVIEWLTPGIGVEQAKKITRELASFQKGDAIFYSPAWLKIVERAHISLCETFDSSKTPEIGEVLETVGRGASINLEQLAASLQADISESTDDTDSLRTRIADLEKQLRERPIAQPERVEVPVLLEAERKAIAQIGAEIDEFSTLVISHLDMIRNVAKGIGVALDRTAQAPKPEIRVAPPPPGAEAVRRTNAERISNENNPKKLGKPERAILTVLAQLGPSYKNRVSLVSGYSRTSSTFDNALSALRKRDYINRGEPIEITEAGLNALGHYEPLPTGRALQEYWLSYLGGAPREVLKALLDAAPRALTKEQISQRSGYSITSSTFQNALSKIRVLSLATGYGDIRASEHLF